MSPAVNNNKEGPIMANTVQIFFPLKESFNFGSLWQYGGLDSFKRQIPTETYNNVCI